LFFRYFFIDKHLEVIKPNLPPSQHHGKNCNFGRHPGDGKRERKGLPIDRAGEDLLMLSGIEGDELVIGIEKLHGDSSPQGVGVFCLNPTSQLDSLPDRKISRGFLSPAVRAALCALVDNSCGGGAAVDYLSVRSHRDTRNAPPGSGPFRWHVADADIE